MKTQGSPKRKIQASLKKLEKSHVHKLTLHLKDLEKEQQIRPNPNRRREIIKIRAEINEKETRKTVDQNNETRSWFFERINKINKPLARVIQKKRQRTQRNKIMNETGEITTNTSRKQKQLLEIITSNYMPTN